MKARDMAKGRNGTRTRTKGSEGNIVFFIEETKGMSSGIAQTPRKLKKE